MYQPKSSSLFHFTKNMDALTSILENGFYPRYCLEDLAWFGYDEHVGFPMVCFCDIPLSRISEHTSFYGEFGIGLTKEWGLRNKLNPVGYFGDNSAVRTVAEYLFDLDKKYEDEKGTSFNQLLNLLRYSKPISGRMYVSGELVEKDFYQESEWRYSLLANEDSMLALQGSLFEEEKDDENKKLETEQLEFLPTDINYIFVKSDADIPQVVDFINGSLGKYPLNDLKILMSRITSLSMIRGDL